MSITELFYKGAYLTITGKAGAFPAQFLENLLIENKNVTNFAFGSSHFYQYVSIVKGVSLQDYGQIQNNPVYIITSSPDLLNMMPQ